MTSTVTVSPALRDFMTRRNLTSESLRSDGSLAFTVDGRYRVRLRPASDGHLALISRICPLPDGREGPESGRLIEKLMNRGAGMLRDYASTLCLDAEDDSLLLQQRLAPTLSGVQVDAEVAEFINVLQFWTRSATTS